MKRKQIAICLIGLLLIGKVAQADPVDREQARTVATNFARVANLNINLTPTKGAEDPMSGQFSNFYVFTGSNGRGFVIVSADDCTTPILGYSEDAPFVFDSMPDHIREWLQGYEDEIAYYRSHTPRAGSTTSGLWQELLDMPPQPGMGTAKIGDNTVVQPLLQTQWDQVPLYNAHCPRHNARRYCPITENDTDTLTGSIQTVTGCVATATAQVMKYWNWPPHGRGSNQYSYSYNEILIYDTVIDGIAQAISKDNTSRSYRKTLSATFADTTFAWDDMPESLISSSSSSEVNAVATLMYNVGIALNMGYGPSSGATTINGNTLGHHTVEEVLRDYFYYSHTVASVQQQDFTVEEWKAMLRHELDAARPIVYKGRSTSGSGHSFVCDGYDDNDMFHFNWGWGGYCDGYYPIGGLNPAPGGTGSATESNYNLGGGAVIGIEPAATMQPETGTTTIIATANNTAYGTVSGSGTYNNWTETVTMTATPAEGHSFVEWSDGNRYNPRRLIASGGCQTFTAIFKPWNSGNVSFCGPFPSSISYYSDSDVLEWGIRIPYSMLGENLVLDKVSFIGYLGAYTIKVYQGGSTPSDGRLVYTSGSLSTTSPRIINQTMNISITANEDVWVTLSGNGKRCITPVDMASSDGCWEKDANGVWHNYSAGYPRPYLITCHFSGTEYSMVEGLTVTSVNGTGATISWSAPTDMTPSDYVLAYGTGYQPEQMHSVTTTANTYSLTGLEANTEYRVFVKACYGSNLRYSDWARATFTTTNVSNPVTITGYANDPALGFVAGCGIYEAGSSVTLQATPMVGCVFVEWDDGYGTNPTRTLTANADGEYFATFERQGYTFTANSNNETLGTVEVEGEASYTIEGTNYYPFLSTITLTAIPNGNATFSHWSDGNTTNPRYCTVMENNPTQTAYFEAEAKGGVSYTSQGLQLSVNTTDIEPVRVYDMLGRQLYACDPTSSTTITFTLPSAGVYIIRVGNYNEKIIIR